MIKESKSNKLFSTVVDGVTQYFSEEGLEILKSSNPNLKYKECFIKLFYRDKFDYKYKKCFIKVSYIDKFDYVVKIKI